MVKPRIHLKGDERMLGDSDFVSSVLNKQNEHLERPYRLQAQGFDFAKVVGVENLWNETRGAPESGQTATAGYGQEPGMLLGC